MIGAGGRGGAGHAGRERHVELEAARVLTAAPELLWASGAASASAYAVRAPSWGSRACCDGTDPSGPAGAEGGWTLEPMDMSQGVLPSDLEPGLQSSSFRGGVTAGSSREPGPGP